MSNNTWVLFAPINVPPTNSTCAESCDLSATGWGVLGAILGTAALLVILAVTICCRRRQDSRLVNLIADETDTESAEGSENGGSPLSSRSR